MSVKLRAASGDSGAQIAEEFSSLRQYTHSQSTAPKRAEDPAAATGPGNARRRETTKHCIRIKYLTTIAAGYSKRKSFYINVWLKLV